MAPHTKAIAAGAAGLAGGAVAARRWRHRRSRPSPSAQGVQAVTVLAPGGEVRAAWEAHAAAADLPAVEIELRTAPGERGTEVLARVAGGTANGEGRGDGHGAGPDGHDRAGLRARLRGEAPDQRLRAELRRFKSRVECGTTVATDAQPSGRGPRQERATRAVTSRLRAWGAA